MKPKTDVAQIETQGLPEKEFPAGPGYRVAISRGAHDAIWRHARESLEQKDRTDGQVLEVGGILLGNVYKDAQGPFLDVSAAIVAEHTQNQGTQMTFTPETWDQVNRMREERFPKLRIVGWYHTHPDFGIFLSDVDKFTHASYFSQPWTTAFVVDPVRQTEGFFLWMGGEPRRAGEYWVEGERRDRAFFEELSRKDEYKRPAATAPAAEPASAVSRASFALATVAGFLALLLVFGYVYMREAQHSDNEKLVMQALDVQRAHLQDAFAGLQQLGKDLQSARKENAEADTALQNRLFAVAQRVQKVADIAGALQVQVATHQRVIEVLPVGTAPAEVSGTVEAKPKEEKKK